MIDADDLIALVQNYNPKANADLITRAYDYGNVMHFVKMMCATVPLMEQQEEMRNAVHDYVMNVIDNEMEIDVELEDEIGVQKTYDGNVVHLNFNTKTGGTA